MKRMTALKLALVLVLGLATRWNAPAQAAPMCELYCGDDICQEGGCRPQGCNTPGNGCREDPLDCPEDCPER